MKSAAIALSILSVALTAQNAWSFETHTHGIGRLSVEVTDTAFRLVLQVPGTDVVGFEQTAESEEERARIASAISDLSKPMDLFVIPPEASCATLSANVALVGDAFRPQDNSTPEAHTEFHADYLVQCEDISAANAIDFAYFERFEGAFKLQVHLTSATGEYDYEVERTAPMLTLPDLP